MIQNAFTYEKMTTKCLSSTVKEDLTVEEVTGPEHLLGALHGSAHIETATLRAALPLPPREATLRESRIVPPDVTREEFLAFAEKTRREVEAWPAWLRYAVDQVVNPRG